MAKLFDKNNKYSMIILAIVILFVVIVAGAIFFSNFKLEKIEGTVAIVMNEGDLVINYVDGNEINIGDTKEHNYGVTISNTSDTKIFYSIYFSEINVSNVSVKISDSEGNVINEIDKDIKNKKIINLFSINGHETIRYNLIIKNNSVNKIKGLLKVDNESLSNETFADLILLNNDIKKIQTRLGDEVATLDEGLIKTIDNSGTSYYFRGNVKNNYVKLDGMYFRIVRINGDNTVRLVLDGALENQLPYNTNTLEEGADLTDLLILDKASITTNLNEWVNTKLSNTKPYLSEAEYCTDTTFNSVINDIRYSATYERIYTDKAPDLFCSSHIYKGIVGLLSADEIVLAGATFGTPNDKYYLYNKDIAGNYLTNSSYFINANNEIGMINVMANGALGEGITITNNSYIRPVINISERAKVKGLGTEEDPYIIVS